MYKKQWIAANIRKLVDLGYVENISSLAISAGMTKPTLTTFMKEPQLRNLSINKLLAIAQAAKVEPWMLLVPDFPFEELKNDRPVKCISPMSYALLRTVESKDDSVKLMLLEAVSASLRIIDERGSDQLKETQAAYMSKRSDDRLIS